MMSYTKDGQIPAALINSRDEKAGVSTEAKRELRKGYLPKYEPVTGADAWEQTGKAVVFEATERDLKK